ncbi:MAG: EamA family transporter RarD [bacterium]|nr:EamA family transporter RarD [bacterium]
MAGDPSRDEALSPSGMGFATACYLAWGLVPIYWKAIEHIPSDEALIPRILWTMLLLMAAATATGKLGELRPAKAREWGWNLLAALLLATNWLIFIYAVQSGQIVATSLGYYINPLMSILLGLVVLGERLNRAQTVAVVVAALGVATLTVRAGGLPWISLALASSFALYGLIHKVRPQPPLGGLAREMLVLTPLSLLAVLALTAKDHSPLLAASAGEHAYLSLTSVVTAGPLLLFHASTRRLPLAAVGMFQYIAPTITLALATFIYGEAFTTAHATGFGFVWIGLVVFTFDSVRRANLRNALMAAE